MKKRSARRMLAAAMALVMVVLLLPASAFNVAAAEAVYTLDTAADLTAMASGEKADGDTLSVGTDDYFTIFFSGSTKIDSSNKEFEDGYTSGQRLNFNGKAQIGSTTKNCIQFTTASAASVKIWWVSGGEGRQMGIFSADGELITQTADTVAQNATCISTLEIPEAGTYYLGGVINKNYIFKVQVTENAGGSSQPARGDWAKVEAPVIIDAVDNGEGEIEVTVQANVGVDGADEVRVTMYDQNGNTVETKRSIAEKSEHTLAFAPGASGNFTFEAVINREGETGKQAEQTMTVGFSLPLTEPIIISATSKGGGKIEVVWTEVQEAASYDVYCNGAVAGSTTDTQYTLEGLTVGETYTLQIVAIRDPDSAASVEMEVVATQDMKQTWGFTYYGPSTNSANNGYVGDLNADGQVTVYSENGKGKIVPASVDGVAFYYTAVPTEYNFTLRAKVTVDSWTYSNGQEGFGLLVTDRLGVSGDSSNFWNNQYMAVATKIEYRYDADTLTVNDLNGTGTKYTMKLGLGTIAKTGVTPENLPLLEASDTDTINNAFLSRMTTLETSAGLWGKETGTYNIIGNYTADVTGTIENEVLTEFILEIQKNNTGYFITYYDAEGNILAQEKYYGADSLSKLDSAYVYAGFFAARNAQATFSDVEFTTILASEDAPAEERPITKIDPIVTISSPTVTTAKDYILAIDSNVSGTVKIIVENEVIVDGEAITGGVRYYKALELKYFGENRIRVEFTPDPDQDLGPDTELSSTKKVTVDTTVVCNKGNYHRKTIYVSPTGLPNGNGSKEYPYDIYTAVNNATAGQTILLMEGTYKLQATVRIQRGMDGTAVEPIRMIADPEAASRPVLDFQGLVAGIVHGGDYWYFAGFDVTNSQAGQKGFQVSGNYNILDQIHAYRNGNTGIQLSRYSGTDLFPDWPANNLILNCTSYANSDPGEEDADGFAAKLTVGEGNVFDGCVAYNNADDGWDMYAKVETGCIGSVTVRNCVAYANGIREDGTVGDGNGNGFKLGGDSLSGKHVLENCYAFYNKAKGIDSNSCPDVIVKNCVSYNNGKYNVALYTNNAANTDFSATGIISFKDSTIPYGGDMTEGENLKPKGTQDTSKYLGSTNYYWDGAASANASGATIGADVFVSLEFKGITRNPDGTINMQGFLERSEKMPADAGVMAGGTPSMEIGPLPEDLEHNYGQEYVNIDLDIHWRECECGDKTDIAEHDLVWIVDKEATETETGLRHRECTVCGHKKAAVTIYPGENTDPTDPAEPTDPTQPSSKPGATQPSGEKPSEPADDAPEGLSPVVIAVIVVAVIAVIGAGVWLIVKFVVKKKNG